MILYLPIVALILTLFAGYIYKDKVAYFLRKYWKKIVSIVISGGLVAGGGLVSLDDIPSSDYGEWVIDGNTVYVNDSLVFASATPHAVHGTDEVVFEFESKVFTGDVDFAWGFNQNIMIPTNIWL